MTPKTPCLLLLCLLAFAPAAGAADDVKAGSAPRPATRPESVVFVVDARAMMLNKWADASGDVVKAVGELKPEQPFDVLVLKDKKVTSLYPRPRAPGPAAAADVGKFLAKAEPVGGGDVQDLLLSALELRPDVISVVSHGYTTDPKKCLTTVANVNKRVQAKINTTTRFVGQGGGDVAASFLWQLANANRGQCLDADGKPVEQDPAPARQTPSGRVPVK